MVSPQNLMKYAWGYAPPLIIGAALQNGVFDTLDAGPKTVAETSAATGASQRGLAGIMNALVALECLTRDSAGRYSLTAESAAFLVRSKPGYMGGIFEQASNRLIPNWLHLAEAVRTGQPQSRVNQEADGGGFFASFVTDLFPMNYPSAIAAADALALAHKTTPTRVLDLAAGSGVWGIAMAQRSPQVTVTAVDWERVLEVTRGMVSRYGMADRFRFVSGDLAQADFGAGYDVATLGHILHSEGVARSRELLRRVFEALNPGGTIIIAEFLVDADRRGPLQGLIFGVNMLVHTEAGNTYSFEEIREWLELAGFFNVGTVPSPGPSPLIFANKPWV
ncbi:MAG TPA: methyltransferase [Bryobacteraceae bacterium]|nr:methyltransferase [Bryobacteraceae bacterium]